MDNPPTHRLRSDIWPHERDVIERPHRLQYVRKLIKPEGCVFCRAAQRASDPESLVLFKNSSMMVVLNKYPYNNGHLLIVPIKHRGEFAKMTEKEITTMGLLTKHSLKILTRVYKPEGFNTGMNLGKVAGAGIPEHLHQHIIPRWGGDTNFFPLIAQTKVVLEETEESYKRLKPFFKRLEDKGVI